jgi:hypothetical protein
LDGKTEARPSLPAIAAQANNYLEISAVLPLSDRRNGSRQSRGTAALDRARADVTLALTGFGAAGIN